MTSTKKFRSCLIILTCAFTGLVCLAWYHGFIPVASGPDKSRIRFALDLKTLPSSVRVNSSGTESWTDYILELDLSISPDQFDQLLSGRDFQPNSKPFYDEKMTSAYMIPDYSGFEIDTTWEWSQKPPNLPASAHGTICTIYTNKTRDRVFIRYTSE